MLLSSLLLLTFLLSDSVDPAAVDIHDVPIVPATAVISDVNGVPACCCWLHYFAASLLLLASLLCWPPSCLFHSAVVFFSAVVACQAIAVILAVACCRLHYCSLHTCCCWRPFTLVPDVLTVAGLPAIV
jgi:hypothetical protein